MKTFAMALAAVVALSASTALAEDGNVSQDALAKMGFSNIETVSDEAGMEVRGKAAYAWGYSSAFTFGPSINFSTGPYARGAENFTAGSTFSVSASFFSFSKAWGVSYASGF